MKAMLYADWMNFRQSIRSILLVMLVFAASAFVWSGPMFFNFIVVFLSIMVPTTLFAADQAYGWNRLSLSLPILRRDVVGSKFVMGAVINLALLMIGLVMTVIYTAYDPAADMAENIAGLLACEAMAFLMMGVLMAVSFKFGIEKGRYIIMACVWVPVLGIFLLEQMPWFEETLNAVGSWLGTVSETQVSLMIAGALAVSLVVYVLCCFISVRIYQKKEL
ncbi:MAG TPA: ABC-2 transporter permease [Candidatus Agathobaculum merdigallinarum]|nr:ABC-2 transporter permease [Candidatus Agathobaculum merdigallinarum]